jgi:low temperature requirement protein LtrA
MHAVAVTWLELFFDLAAVVATHNTATPLEHGISLSILVSYFLRSVLLWWSWHSVSLTVNLGNQRRFKVNDDVIIIT